MIRVCAETSKWNSMTFQWLSKNILVGFSMPNCSMFLLQFTSLLFTADWPVIKMTVVFLLSPTRCLPSHSNLSHSQHPQTLWRNNLLSLSHSISHILCTGSATFHNFPSLFAWNINFPCVLITWHNSTIFVWLSKTTFKFQDFLWLYNPVYYIVPKIV